MPARRSLPALLAVGLLLMGQGPCIDPPGLSFGLPEPGTLIADRVRVALFVPAATDPASVVVRLDGEVVTAELRSSGGGLFGVLRNVAPGPHVLTAEVLGAGAAAAAASEVGFESIALDRPDECELLNDVECLLPFPSSRFLESADTPTGVRVQLPASGMPALPTPISAEAYSGQDGFSPMVQILTHFPGGVDPALSGASRLLADIDTRTYDTTSLSASSPTLLLDVDTGLTPVLHFIEPDAAAAAGPNPEREVLFLRPGVSLTPGHRYVVAMRNLVHPDGSDVEAEPAFAALRDGTPTQIPAIEARRASMESLFETLSSAGVARDELVLAFDFVVQSSHGLTHEMLSMRDQAFAWLDAQTQPTFNVFPIVEEPTESDEESFENDCSDPDVTVWRELHGRYDVPLFLDSDPRALPKRPGRLLDTNGDGTPDFETTMAANFSVSIPCSVLEAGGTPKDALLVGHGLFGRGADVVNLPRFLGTLADPDGELAPLDYVAGATDWHGLSTFDFSFTEINFIVNKVIGNASNFGALPDRKRQGMTNALILGRMLKRGLFNVDPLFQTPEGVGVLGGCHGPTVSCPESPLYYYGVSLGGVMGLMFTALSPDVANAALDVPASNFSLLIQRSQAIGLVDQAINLLNNDPMTQALFFSLGEELWDSGESAGYLTHITEDPLPGSGGPKKLLMLMARYDGVVSNQATEIAARTLGLPNLHDAGTVAGSVLAGFPAIADQAPPLSPVDAGFRGAWLTYDVGTYDTTNPEILPLLPPLSNTRASAGSLGNLGCEPHGARISIPAGATQIDRWLRPDGVIDNFCSGVCDARNADSGEFEPNEISRGNEVPCDPLAE